MFQVKCESKQAMLKKITNYSILFMIYQLQTFQNSETYRFFSFIFFVNKNDCFCAIIFRKT